MKKITKPFTSGMGAVATGIVLSPFTAGASLALTAKGAMDVAKDMKKSLKPNITTDVSGAIGSITEEQENAKKARAKLLATSGGILGERVSAIQSTMRNLFGN